MTSSLSDINWTADNTDMVDLDGICLHSLVSGGPGESADTRGEADVIPGLIGMQPRLWEKERRVIMFEGWVRGVGDDEDEARSDFWDNCVSLANVLDPTEIIELVLTVGNGSYSINARPTSIAYNRIVPAHAVCSVEFESFDPDWVASGS